MTRLSLRLGPNQSKSVVWAGLKLFAQGRFGPKRIVLGPICRYWKSSTERTLPRQVALVLPLKKKSSFSFEFFGAKKKVSTRICVQMPFTTVVVLHLMLVLHPVKCQRWTGVHLMSRRVA